MLGRLSVIVFITSQLTPGNCYSKCGRRTSSIGITQEGLEMETLGLTTELLNQKLHFIKVCR